MHRTDLLTKLDEYVPISDRDRDANRRITEFVRANDRCFDRSLKIGHITGSAWLINRDGSRALLTHHRKLDLWLQLGGHCDGNSDVLTVALREAREESGIADIQPRSTKIFDVDVHPIPARKEEQDHFHYDVRFLLQTKLSDEYTVSDESHDLAWCTSKEIIQRTSDESVLCMNKKWQADPALVSST